MRPTLTEEQIAEIVGGYYGQIQSAIFAGFQDYQESLRDAARRGSRTTYKARTSANVIHDSVRTRLMEAFVDNEDVKAKDFNGIFGLQIADRVFIRFKKLNLKLKAANVKTGQAQSFTKQQLEFPGLGRLTTLTAGYIPNATWTAIDNIYLTCQVGNVVIWYKDLHGQAAQPSMFGSSNGSVPSGESLVKVKRKTNLSSTGTDN